jgi:mycothiol synthase
VVGEVTVESRTPVAERDAATVRTLADAAAAVDRHPSLGDGVWRDLDAPGSRSAVLVASRDGEPVGALHVSPAENEPGRLTAGVVVLPEHRPAVTARLAAAARALVTGEDELLLWVFGGDDATDQALRAIGYERARELRQLRVPLPLDEEPGWPDGVHVRSFEPGRDEEEWLAVNNRAFAADPDQHGWTRETLERREREPWFDADGFLLAFDDAGLAGSCWTKLHDAGAASVVGEIYVIGVDPDRQGTGLGRALVVGGLASLHRRGASEGMLFVDAANDAALRLYESMGFEVARVDRAYRWTPS